MTDPVQSEFRSGWPVLFGSFVGIACGVSSVWFYSLGLFIKPLATEFHWSRGEASLGPLVSTLAAAFAAPFAGRIVDRVGAARTAVLSMLLFAGGMAAIAAGTQGLSTYLLLVLGMSLVAVGSSPLTYSRLLVAAFDRHRGLALGLALMGTGLGAALTPMLLGPYISAHGWRAGYYALAAVVLAASVPVALLTRGRNPGRATASPPLSTILRDPMFARLGVIFLLAAAAVLGSAVHFVALLSDAGIPAARAGALAGSVGAAVIAGRVIAGVLLDRFAASIVMAGLFAISAAGMALLATAGAGQALAGALAIGLAIGSEVDLLAFLVARHFAAAAYGAAYGGLYALFLIGGAVGPAIIGALFDVTGSYAVPLYFAAGLLCVAALLALRLPRTARAPIVRARTGLRV